jgi:sulfite reductase beta subunit-like hemoprotein
VDLPRIARHLAKIADERGDFRVVPLSENGIDVVIILCGCPRACGNKAEVRTRAKQSLVIAGESLGGRVVPETYLPSAAEKELIKILES